MLWFITHLHVRVHNATVRLIEFLEISENYLLKCSAAWNRNSLKIIAINLSFV